MENHHAIFSPHVSKREKRIKFFYISLRTIVCVCMCAIELILKPKGFRHPQKRLYVQYVLTCICKLILFHSLTDITSTLPRNKTAGWFHPPFTKTLMWKKDFLVILEWVLECVLMWVELYVMLPYIFKGWGGKTYRDFIVVWHVTHKKKNYISHEISTCPVLCCVAHLCLKGLFTQKRKLTHPKFVSNLYECLSFVEHKKLCWRI